MDIFIPIFMCFTIFVLCSLCGFCCKKQNEGAIYSTPVVITSQTHQPVGARTAYPVQQTSGPGVVQSSYHTTIVSAPAMPMPYSDSAPYPTGPLQYPSAAPYPPVPFRQQEPMSPPAAQACPYPPQSAPYGQQAMPPTYTDVMGNQTYQKQSPYNPGYSG